MTHRIIANAAKGIAGAFYEGNRSVRFRFFWPDQEQYIGRNWPDFVEEARAMLAQSLGEPGLSAKDKEDVYNALLADHQEQLRHNGAQHDANRFLLKPEEPGKVEQKIVHELNS